MHFQSVKTNNLAHKIRSENQCTQYKYIDQGQIFDNAMATKNVLTNKSTISDAKATSEDEILLLMLTLPNVMNAQLITRSLNSQIVEL